MHAMLSFQAVQYGNPSSLHYEGRMAREAVESARQRVAALLKASPTEIIFTASGTEANNLALKGLVAALGVRNCHVVTSAIEHPSVLAPCQTLEGRGIEITYLPVDTDGLVHPEALRQAIRSTTRLVSVMTANNVVGTVQPIEELGHIAHECGAWFHTDAVQAAGKMVFDMRRQPIDLLTMSAHKIYGPQGVGALYCREGIPLHPVIDGGGQEHGRRSGTEAVVAIIGFGTACELADQEMSAESVRLAGYRDRLFTELASSCPNLYLIGHSTQRLPGHLCLGFAGMEAEAMKLLLALDDLGIAVSSGSACSAHHAGEPSHILMAMGFDVIRARGSLRISLGRFTTDDDIEYLLEAFPRALATLRRTAGSFV